MPNRNRTMSIDAIAQPADATPPGQPSHDPLRAIAGQLSSPRVDRGLLAALRRFNPVSDGRHNLFEVQQVLLAAGIDLPADHPRQPRWALVVHCLAIVRGAHHAQRDTGAKLADLGFSEARLRQLLEADGPLLGDLLPTLARRVAAAGVSLNWWPLAELALDGDDGQDRARKARIDIAQGFLRATAAKAAA